MGNDRIEFEEIKAIALEELDNSKNLNEWLERIVQSIYQKGKESTLNEELLEFARWVAKEACCSDEEWENKHWAIQELLCRKLAKLGIITVEDDEYIYEYDDEDGET